MHNSKNDSRSFGLGCGPLGIGFQGGEIGEPIRSELHQL